MIKKFALLATVAALFVACSESPESMEKAQPETDATAQEMIEEAEADAEVVVAPETTETEEVVVEDTETPAVVEGAEVEETK